MTHCIWLTPVCRSAAMLLTARLTTDVSICANNTPSEVATRTMRGRVCSVKPSHVETMVMLISPRCNKPDLGDAPGRLHPNSPPDSSENAGTCVADAADEANIFNRMHDKYWCSTETCFILLVNDELRRLTGKVKNRFPLNFEFQRLTHDSSIEEEFVGKISSAAVALIIAIVVYFTLFWGYDGLRILTSPSYGLDAVWRSQ